MLSGANAFLSLALLWRMPGGAQHGQENDFIRLMLICRRISKASNRRAWLSAVGTTTSQASKFPPITVSQIAQKQ